MALCAQSNFTGISLCAGVGGLELGLHVAEPRYRTVCFVEREAFTASVLVARMADKTLDQAPIWDDVKSFDGSPWRGRVHILSAGYPCQPFSFSGRRKGKNDPRHLWPDIKRIVDEIKPEWCFFENVDGHLNLGAAEVFKDLREMGYSPKAGLFSALETGASHLRKRLFILAHADDKPLLQSNAHGAFHERAAVPERPDTGGQSSGTWEYRSHVDTNVYDGKSHGGGENGGFQVPLYPPAPHQFGTWGEILERRPDLQPELFGLDNGVANWVDRSRSAGNGVCPLVAAYAFQTLHAEFVAL
ncbi:MAG: DNA cytosine methyltransferase [Pseudomonadota bacterium]